MNEDDLHKFKLKKTEIDITTISEDHLLNFSQYTARRTKPASSTLESLFDWPVDN